MLKVEILCVTHTLLQTLLQMLQLKQKLMDFMNVEKKFKKISTQLRNLWSALKTVFHCVKSAKIRSNFWSVFSCIWTKYEVSLRIQSEYGKIRTSNYSVFGHFSRSDGFGCIFSKFRFFEDRKFIFQHFAK